MLWLTTDYSLPPRAPFLTLLQYPPQTTLLGPQAADAYPRFRDRSHTPQEPARRRSTPNVSASRRYSPPLAIFAPRHGTGSLD